VADDRQEPADQDRRPAVTREELLRPLDVFLADQEELAVLSSSGLPPTLPIQ